MLPYIIIGIVALIVIIILVRCVRIVQQAKAYVIERLQARHFHRYSRKKNPAF